MNTSFRRAVSGSYPVMRLLEKFADGKKPPELPHNGPTVEPPKPTAASAAKTIPRTSVTELDEASRIKSLLSKAIEQFDTATTPASRTASSRQISDLARALKDVQGNRGRITDILRSMGIAAGLGGGLALGAYGVGSAYEAIHRMATRKSRFENMLAEYPDLRKHRADAERAFDVIHNYAPEITASPHVASAWVRKAVEYPEAGISPQSIRELIETQRALAEMRRAPGNIPGILRSIHEPGTRAALAEM